MARRKVLRFIETFLVAWALMALFIVAPDLLDFRLRLGPTLGGAVLLPLLGAFVGPFAGLLSRAPYFTGSFKLCLGAALVTAFALVWVGVHEKRCWRYAVARIAGILLWMLAGMFGFGPQ